MHVRSSFAARSALLLLAVLGAVQLACAGGHIPPSTFQFTNVVPLTGKDELRTGGCRQGLGRGRPDCLEGADTCRHGL